MGEDLIEHEDEQRMSREAAAERLRAAVATEPVATADGARLDITVSVGVSRPPSPGAPLDALVAAADDALYAAKRAGRDRVRRAAAEGFLDDAAAGGLGPAADPVLRGIELGLGH